MLSSTYNADRWKLVSPRAFRSLSGLRSEARMCRIAREDAPAREGESGARELLESR
jgi:hypothetical protein